MSSVQVKRNGAFKNLLLLRTASIDKIKCTAYPLLGSIFERKFTLNHNDDLINLSSRKNAAVQFLYIIMTTTLNLIRTHTGGVSFETLEKFIAGFNNQLKSKLHSYSKERVETKNEETDSAAKCTNDVIRREKDQVDSSQRDEKFYEFAKPLKDSTTKPATLKASDENVKSVGLLKLSYGLCLAVVYIQLSMLLLMIGFCAFRLGFFFLLACVATIAYLVLKISFLKKKDGAKKHHNNRRSRLLVSHESKATTSPIAFVIPQFRLSNIEKFPSTTTQSKQKIL